MLLVVASLPLASLAFGLAGQLTSGPSVGGVTMNVRAQLPSEASSDQATSGDGVQKEAASAQPQGLPADSAAPGASGAPAAGNVGDQAAGNVGDQAAGNVGGAGAGTGDQSAIAPDDNTANPSESGSVGSGDAQGGAAADKDSALLDPVLGGMISAKPSGANGAESKLDPNAPLVPGVADALAAVSPATSDPAGFAWSYAPIAGSETTCKIVGYTYYGSTGGNVLSGTVHVPAVNPDNGKLVVAIDGGYAAFANLHTGIDFSAAVNLERIGSDRIIGDQYAFNSAAISGPIDLSKNTKLKLIGQSAFQTCLGITSVTLPPNLTKLSDYAFNGDSRIVGPLSIPSTLTYLGASAFNGAKLTSVTIPDNNSLQPQGTWNDQIGASAFKNNNIGGTLTLPANITNVGSSAFMNNKIENLDMKATSNLSLNSSAFQNNRIANDVFSGRTFSVLGDSTFKTNKLSGHIALEGYTNTPSPGVIADNPGITSVSISGGWGYIPANMFQGNTGLTDVTIVLPPGGENKIRHIMPSAFEGCTALTSLDLKGAPLFDDDANKRKAVGDRAFFGDVGLRSIKLTATTLNNQTGSISVGNDAFNGCTNLFYIDLPVPSGPFPTAIKIGDRAFMHTNLGAFPAGEETPATPLGYLPLDRRNIVSIGANAFDDAKLENVHLPGSLTTVGDQAFADNYMWRVDLPPSVTTLGTQVLFNQQPKEPVYWGNNTADPSSKADVLLRAINDNYGLNLDSLTSVSLDVPMTTAPEGGMQLVSPQNNTPGQADYWQATEKATFTLNQVTTAKDLRLSYDVSVPGRPSVTSTGDAVVKNLQKGVQFTFHWLFNWNDSSKADTRIQWVGDGEHPDPSLNGGNYGFGPKAGYSANDRPYDAGSNTGWSTAVPPGASTGVNPAAETAQAGVNRDFYNVWIGDTYTLKFDDNFGVMMAKDNSLGIKNPQGSFKPNPDYVWGSLGPLANLTYGTPQKLPLNKPPTSASAAQGTGFKMGGYEFQGWATAPDLAESDRVEGSNFFSDGADIAEPVPAPESNGGSVTLYAQWKEVDLSDPGHITGSILIPSSIQLGWTGGGYLWSQAPHKDGDPAPADPQAITVSTEPEGPGSVWPDDKKYAYQVFVQKPDPAKDDLLVLSRGDGTDSHPIDVLQSKNGAPYSPGAGDALTTPLLTLQPVKNGVHAPDSASFYLRSRDKAGSFATNIAYEGKLTFVFRTVVIP